MFNSVVTGGTGFIGSNLALRLRKEGHELRIYDNLSRGMSPLLKETQFDIVKADILDFERLLKEFRGIEYVFHNAALRSIPLSIEEPVKTSNVNILGTLNVLEAARRRGVKRVILASSSSLYGNNPLPFKENMQPKPLSLYASAKVANEHHAKLYHELYGLETICLRYFNVFGCGQDGAYKFSPVIPRFIHAILNGKRPVVFGDGEQSRDFTFIENVVEANLLAMKAGKKAVGKAFNVAQGEGHSLNKIIQMVNGLVDKEIEPIYADSRKGDLKDTCADLSVSGKVLGYKPATSFEDGLKATVKWYRRKMEK